MVPPTILGLTRDLIARILAKETWRSMPRSATATIRSCWRGESGRPVRPFGFDVQPEVLEAMRRGLGEAKVEACPRRGGGTRDEGRVGRETKIEACPRRGSALPGIRT